MECDYVAYIEDLLEEVVNSFEKMIRAVNDRKTSLVKTLTELAEKFRKNQTIIEEELESISSLLENSHESTSNLSQFDERMRLVQEKRDKLTEMTRVNYASIKWDHKLIERIGSYGTLCVTEGDLYSSRFERQVSTQLNQSSIPLKDPSCLAVDPISQEICLLDSLTNRGLLFSQKGEYKRQFGQGLLSMWGGMSEPRGISLRGTRVFVTQSQGHCLREYQLNGNLTAQVGSHGNSPRQFNTPLGLDSDSTNIFVCDCYNNRIQVLDYKLDFVRRFSGVSLKFPRQIQVLDARLFVLTQYKTCVQEIDKQDGSWVRSIITLEDSSQISRISFSFDRARNIFLCNPASHTVSVLSHNSLQLLHKCEYSAQDLVCVASSEGDMLVLLRERDSSEIRIIRV